MNRKTALIIVIILIVVALAAVIIITGQNSLQGNGGGPTTLPAVEVRSYQGQDLSSINDFHENSINGPQYINITDYRLTVTGLTNTTIVYTYADILGKYPHYSKVVTLHCVEGWDATILWEGVQVRDLIRMPESVRAQIPSFSRHMTDIRPLFRLTIS